MLLGEPCYSEDTDHDDTQLHDFIHSENKMMKSSNLTFQDLGHKLLSPRKSTVMA